MKHEYPLNVPNQFHFSKESKTACVPISIQATFHMYEAFVERNEMLSDKQWHKVMTNGTILWQRWKAKPENRDEEFPTIHEILAMKECATFNRIFGTEPIDYGGLIKTRKGVDNAEGSLLALVIDLVSQPKNACALLIMPVNICISLVCRKEHTAPHGYAIFLFDSHGNKETKMSELTQFFDYHTLVEHVLAKYPVESLDSLPRRVRALYSETEIATDFGYHALLFVR